ncbi:CRAL-TRIO domain containing protein, partial [Oryctes borbonicus]
MASSAVFRLETDQISEETKQIATKELRETEEIVECGFRELRELLTVDSSLYYSTEEEFLRIFLRPCKYYAKSAYRLMERIADYRAKHYDIIGNILPQDLKHLVDSANVFNVLINRDQKGRRIMICCSRNWDPSKVTTDQLLQMLYMIHIASLAEPETQVRGFVVVIDCKDIGMKHIRNFTPSFAGKLLTFLQQAMPLRLKEFHIINNPFIFNIAWAIVKPLLIQKAKNRIILHGKNIASLHQYLAPTHLPEDFGGYLPKIWYSSVDWYPTIEQQSEFIKKWNACG